MNPVEECFHYFPQFRMDFRFLVEKEFVIEAEHGLIWPGDETSLGLYFHNFKKSCKKVKGGFWRPIETAFNKTRGSLRHLVSSNGRGPVKPSIYYDDLMEKLGQHRKKLNDIVVFLNIQKIIQDADDKNYNSMKQSLDKIMSLIK
jgi:hypothetical protein